MILSLAFGFISLSFSIIILNTMSSEVVARTGLFAATPPSIRLNSRVLPSSSLVSKQWPGRYVGAADVLTQTSDRRASFNGVDFVYSQRGIHYIEIYLNGEVSEGTNIYTYLKG